MALTRALERKRFGFLADLDDDEKRFAALNAREHHEVLELLATVGFRT